MSRAFPDTNVLVYAFTDDPRRDRARAVIKAGGTISVQVLNEFANVARRKLQMDWREVVGALAVIRRRFPSVVPVDLKVHEHGLRLAASYRLNLYDAMIVAAALKAGCDLLWSEDMQDGLLIGDRLRIVNPFRG